MKLTMRHVNNAVAKSLFDKTTTSQYEAARMLLRSGSFSKVSLSVLKVLDVPTTATVLAGTCVFLADRYFKIISFNVINCRPVIAVDVPGMGRLFQIDGYTQSVLSSTITQFF